MALTARGLVARAISRVSACSLHPRVGLALNFNAPSDLDVAFDYIHFEPLPTSATAGDCTSD